MDFSRRQEVLQLLGEAQFKAFMADNSESRTGVIASIVRCMAEVETLTESTLDELPTNMSEHEDYADVFTAEEWMSEGVRGCAFIPSDGGGYWGTENEHSYDHTDVFGAKPSWATHVAWFNK
jgi:hypothetical protein